MRITQRAVAQTSLQGLNQNLSAIAKLQQQLTSGRTINAPSDSPTGTNRAMQTRSDTAAATQQARNISDGKAWLDSTDSTLQSMLSQVRKVRELTVQAANTGAMTETAAAGIKAEVQGLRESLLGLANTVVQGRPVFGGVTSGPRAYADDGTFIGRADAPVTRRISDSESIRIDISGPEALGDGPTGLLSVVEKVAGDVGALDSAELAKDLAALDEVMNRLLVAAASVGTRASRVERAEQVNTDLQLTLTTQLAEVENVDLPKTIMELEMQKVGYEAALSATSKAIQKSLVDFLR